MEAAVVLTRLVQYLAVSAVGGASLFYVYGAPAGEARAAQLAIRLAAAFGIVGVAVWLVVQAAELGAGPSDAFRLAAVWDMAAGTGFGRAALARAAMLGLALAISFAPAPSQARYGLAAVLGLAASASFAWTGHGAADDGLAGAIHLAADVVHLVAAAIWVGALFALSPLLAALASNPDAARARRAVNGLNDFSRIGVPVVIAIAASGLVNSWFLVGLRGFASLLTTPYGQLLAAKLLLFVLMLGLAAANRYLHTPRLAAMAEGAMTGISGFQSATRSVLAETIAAGLVLVLVSWLGTLAPSAHA